MSTHVDAQTVNSLRTDIPLFVLVRMLLPEKRFILSFTAICTIISLSVAFLLPAIYRSEVLVDAAQIGQQGGGQSTLASLAGSLTGGLASSLGMGMNSGPALQDAIATIKSRVFTDKFIKDNGLFPILFASIWDKDQQRWIEKSWKFWKKIPPSNRDAFEAFDKIRDAQIDDKTGLIVVSIEWTDPELASAWANALVKQVNQYMRADAVLKTKRNLKYLEDYLRQTTQVEIQRALSALMETELQKSMSANVNEEYSFVVIDPAVIPEKRAKPYRLLLTLVGFLFGFMISVLWKIIKVFWTRSEGPTTEAPKLVLIN